MINGSITNTNVIKVKMKKENNNNKYKKESNTAIIVVFAAMLGTLVALQLVYMLNIFP